MIKYKCENCDKEFLRKFNYESHNRRKIPCMINSNKSKKQVDTDVEGNLKDLTKIVKAL